MKSRCYYRVESFQMVMRFLIRLANKNFHPKDSVDVTRSLRGSIPSNDVRIGGLRVSSHAIEFDVFTRSEEQMRQVLPLISHFGEPLTIRRLDVKIVQPKDKRLVVEEARRYFNEERFWECHEALEDIWKISEGEEKTLLQGIILVAAAFVHFQKGRGNQCLSILRRAASFFRWKTDQYHSIDIAALFKSLDRILLNNKIELFEI